MALLDGKNLAAEAAKRARFRERRKLWVGSRGFRSRREVLTIRKAASTHRDVGFATRRNRHAGSLNTEGSAHARS
jgi:hypothetical protein